MASDVEKTTHEQKCHQYLIALSKLMRSFSPDIPFDETTAFNNCYSICGMKEVTVSLKLETENLQKMYETVRKLLNSTSGGDLGSHDAFACKDACEELVEDYEHRRRRKANFETSLSSDEDDDIDASMENQKKAAFQAAKDEFLEIEEDNRIEEEEDEAEEPSSVRDFNPLELCSLVVGAFFRAFRSQSLQDEVLAKNFSLINELVELLLNEFKELDPVFTRFLLEHVAIGLKVVIETYRTLRMYRDSENEGGFIEKLSADVSQLHFLIAQYTYECSFKLSTEDFIGLYCSEKDLQILMTLSQNAMLHAIYDIAAQMNQNWKEAVIVMFSFLSLAPDESTLKWLTEKLRVFISWTAPVDSESFNRLIVELLLLKSSEGYSTVILRDIAQCLLLVDDRTILFKVLSGLDLYIIGNVLEEDNETVEFLFTSFTAAMENSAATDQSPTAENSLKTISEHKWTHVTVDEVEYETVSAVRSPLSLSHSIDLSSSSDLHFNIVLSLVKFCQLDLIENQLLLRFEKMSLELYEFVLYESSGDDEQRFAEEAERRDFLKKQEAFTNLLMAYLHRQTGEKAFMKILEIIPAATNEKPLIPVFLYTVEQNLFVIIKSPVVIGALSHRVSGSLELVQRFIGYYRTGRKFEDFAEYVGLAIDLFKLTLHLSLSTFLSERFTNRVNEVVKHYLDEISSISSSKSTKTDKNERKVLEVYLQAVPMIILAKISISQKKLNEAMIEEIFRKIIPTDGWFIEMFIEFCKNFLNACVFYQKLLLKVDQSSRKISELLVCFLNFHLNYCRSHPEFPFKFSKIIQKLDSFDDNEIHQVRLAYLEYSMELDTDYSEVLSFVLQKTARENHLKAILEIYTASPNHCKATILKHWISLQNQTFKKPVCESFRSNCSVVIRHPAANSNPCERKRGSTVNYQGNSPFVYDSGTGITFTFSLRLYHDGMKSAATIKLGRFSIKIVFTDVSVCRLMIHYKSKCISDKTVPLFLESSSWHVLCISKRYSSLQKAYHLQIYDGEKKYEFCESSPFLCRQYNLSFETKNISIRHYHMIKGYFTLKDSLFMTMVGHQAVDHTNLSPGASQNLSKDFREVAENFLEYADTINLRKLDYNACDVYEQTFDEGSYHLEIQNVSATRSMEYTINEENELVKQNVEPNNPKNYLTDQFIAAGGIRLVIYLIAKELGDSANPEILNELLRLYLAHLTVSDERYPVDLSIRVLMRLMELPQFAMTNDLLENILSHVFRYQLKTKIGRRETSEEEFASDDDLEIENYLLGQSLKNHGLITDGRFLYYFIQSCEIWSHRPQHFARVIHILRSVTQKERNRDLWNRGKLKVLFPDLLQTILKLSQNPAFNENTLEEDSFGEDYAYLIKSLLQSLLLEKMSEEPLTLIWNTLFLLQPTSDTLFPMKSLNFLDLLGASAFDDIRASMVSHLVGTVGDSNDGSNVGDDGQSSLQNEEDSRSRSSVESWQKKWVVVLKTGLTRILSDFVLNGPDEAVSSLLQDDLRTDCVLVMLTHQEDINLREAVVELLCNVLLRASKVQKMVFLNSRQYILLACEMRQQGVTLKMASCLFSIVFGESVDIRNGLDSTHVNGFTPDRLSCEILNVIYALLERSCMECPTTFAHICAALGKICEHNSQLQQAMMDRRLPEILTNVAIKISHLWQKQNEVSSETKFEQLREPFMRLTSGIILQAIPTGEKKIFENAKKFLHLLIAAERQVDEAEGKAANVFLRKLLCTLLVESIGLCQIFVDERGQYHRSASVASSVVGSDSDSSLEDSDCYVMVEVPHVNEEYFKPSPLTRNLSMFYNTLMQKASKKARSLDCPYKVKAVRTTNALEIAKHFAEIITLCHRAFSVMRAKDEVEEWENVFFSSYVEILVTAQAYTIARAPWYINALEEARSCFCKVFADTFFDSNRKETMGNGNYNILNEFYIERKRKLMNVRTGFPQNYLIPLLSQHLELNDLIRQGILEVLRHHPPESNFVQEVRDFAAWFGWTSLANGFLDGDSEQAFRSTLEMGLVGVVDEKRRILSRLQELVLNCHQSSLPTSDDEDLNDLLTKHVLIRQNAARKEAFDLSAKLSTKLGNIVEELQHCSSIVFHPRSPVFQSKHWPKTVVLSSVEGTQHERLRLVPGEVNIPKEHLQDCSLYEGEYSRGPLEKIIEHFNGNEEEIDIHKTSHSEIFYNIIFLKNGDEVSGTLIINDQEIVFLSYETKKRTMFKVVLSKITRIYKRRFVLEDVAVELLLKKKSYFFAFPNSENRDTVVDFIDEEKARNVNVEMEAKLLAESWRGGNISNFRFLGELNKLAGRTYDDLMQYPVMPFVIADYSSNHLDLTKSSSYRNLKIPISLQLPEMVNVYKELFSHYESIYKEALSHKDPKKKEQYVPHHYASLFSNPGIVTHLLVRLYPFSKHALVLQDGSFDLPDRLFSSVESTYRLVTQSKTDYKELLPEWFTTPEAFKNVLKLNLGKKQDGFVVDDVVVPPWANGCARKFIHAQRFALEQPQVTEKLNGWIDLVFGCKQKGKAAIEAINVFNPVSYPTNSESLPDDPVEGRARETMKRQYGQMPDQLFFSPLHMPFSKFKHPVHILGYLPEFRASGEDIMTTVDPCNAILPFPVSAFMNTIQGKLFGGLLRSMTNKDVFLHLYPTFDMEDSLDLSLVLMETIDKVQCFRISEKRKKIAICYENGVVDVLKISKKAQDGKKLSMASTEKRCTFYTQTPVVDLCFCLPFSFVVTAQEKGTVCVWDLNTRKFVVEKSLLPEGTSKAMVRVNQANGDIGIISPNFSTNETTISVCTVNLLFLETIKVAGIVVDAEISNLDPGRGVACLVCLLQDQSIQIYEMLNLTRIFSYELPQDRKHIKIGFLDNGNIGLYSDCGVLSILNPLLFRSPLIIL